MYPENWPECPSCGEFALDGQVTCGSACCKEQLYRDIQRYQMNNKYEEQELKRAKDMGETLIHENKSTDDIKKGN